jgi:hypothetical protein
MNNYLDLLKRFQELWNQMRNCTLRQNANNTSFHCSFLDAQILKDQIPQSELKQFVKLMYPNSLLVQIAHAHPWIHQNLISNSEEKENTFPQINGILSTIDSHICPAAMPTMLLYEKLNNEFVTQKYTNFQNLGEDLLREVPYSNRNREAEKSVWKNETDFFDESIELAINNFDTLLKILFSKPFRHSNELKNIFSFCHLNLKKSILTGDESNRIINY